MREPRDPGIPQDGGNRWWPWDLALVALVLFGLVALAALS